MLSVKPTSSFPLDIGDEPAFVGLLAKRTASDFLPHHIALHTHALRVVRHLNLCGQAKK